jgi:hypothetical protein
MELESGGDRLKRDVLFPRAGAWRQISNTARRCRIDCANETFILNAVDSQIPRLWSSGNARLAGMTIMKVKGMAVK